MSSSMTGYQGMKNKSTGFKAPEGYNMYQQYTPQQMKTFKQGFKHVGPDSWLSKLAGGDQSMFEQMEAPAMQQFQDLMSQNASQFSGMGMGARHGSGFNNTQSQATADFTQGLQSKRMDIMRDSLKDLMGYSHQLLGESPYGLKEEQPGFMDALSQGAGQGAGQAIGQYGVEGVKKLVEIFGPTIVGALTGGPAGAAAGAGGTFLQKILSMFGGK